MRRLLGEVSLDLLGRGRSPPVTRETGGHDGVVEFHPTATRPSTADQPAYPAAARSSGTRQSLPDSAVPIVAWRIPARPGPVALIPARPGTAAAGMLNGRRRASARPRATNTGRLRKNVAALERPWRWPWRRGG